MKREKLSLEEINLKDERFRVSFYFYLEKMVNSLKKIGLVNPPLVAYRNSRFILVSGWKRVLGCLQLSLSPIPVKMSYEEDDLQTFLMAFYENLATRKFSIVEKAEVIHRLKKFGVKENQIIKNYLPLLDVSPSSFYYEGYLALAQFESEIKEAIQKKNIPFFSFQKLLEFKPDARKHVFPILLPLGQNKQKEILEDLQEISQREDCFVEEILEAEEIQEILNSEKLAPLQKANKIRHWLRKKRFPSLCSWEESFASSLKKMHCPKEIAIKHSPFFEDENISVTFSFKSKEEFEKNLLKLQNIASDKEFPRLFNLNYS